MTNLFSLFLSGALVLGVGADATAGTPRVDRRETRQQKRIVKGVKSGELTASEVARLEVEQARVRRLEARAKADGVTTARERARIHRELDQASRHIYRQKRD